MELKKTICPLDCPDACGVVATMDGETIVKLDGDKEHPFTAGFLCKKVRTYHHRVQSEDRIFFPQKRVGKKGEGKFERISWDEAYQIMVDRLTEIKETHGGEALLPYSYAGNMGKVNRWAGYPFFHKYGASQLLHTICSAAAGEGWYAHYGSHPNSPPEKVLDSDLVVAWGINIKVSNIHFMPMVLNAKKKGAKFVVIDPYINSTGKVADYYFPVKPGGDTALALGVFKILLEKGALDRSFIEQHSEGFEELQSYLKTMDLDECVRKSGLNLEQFNQLADLFIQYPKAFVRIGIGLSRNSQGAMSVRAIACLSAALGLFDGAEGKGALLSSGGFPANSEPIKHTALMEKPTREINMVQLGQALNRLAPPIHALFVYNSNPLSVAPDAGEVRRGLEREDLFTIVHEQFLTPTARYADLLLPATTSFENDDFYTSYGHFYASKIEPVVQPKGEAICNFELFQTLAQKMGFSEAIFQETIHERIDKYLDENETIPSSVKENGVPAGLIFRSENFEDGGNYAAFGGAKFKFSVSFKDPKIPRIPCILDFDEFEDPDLKSRFPFQLITPPMVDLLNSTFGERYVGKKGNMMIHPDDAVTKGIETGDTVKVFNGRGHNIRQAQVTENTQAGLLVLEGIFWEDGNSGGNGVNDLTSQKTTDLGGGGTYHEARVDVVKL